MTYNILDLVFTQVRPPSSRIVELLAMGPHSEDATMSQYAGRHYSLEEILEEGMLYEELLSHLSKSHSADRYNSCGYHVLRSS